MKRLALGIALLATTTVAHAASTKPYGTVVPPPAHVLASPPWKGLPVRTTAAANKPGDPINIALEGSKAVILADFLRVGWVKADPLSTRHDLHLAEAALHHGAYPTAPVSNLYLFGRAEDFAVEHEIGSVASRDHARFWDTGRKDPITHEELWISDCSRDIAIKILRGKHGVPDGTTHKIDGHLDAERNLIVSEMEAAHVVLAVVVEPGIGKPAHLTNSTGDALYTDGNADVIVLK